MNAFMKYLPLVALGKDVSESYYLEHGKDRPAYLSRRFIGAMLALISGALAIHWNINLDATHVTSLADNIEKLVSSAMAVWGSIVAIVGVVKRKKNSIKSKLNG